jgi:hypothetical protein
MGIFCEAIAFIGHKIDIPECKFENEDEAYAYEQTLDERMESIDVDGSVNMMVDNCDELRVTFILVKGENCVCSHFKLGGNDLGRCSYESTNFTDYSTDDFEKIEKSLGHTIDRQKKIFCVSKLS